MCVLFLLYLSVYGGCDCGGGELCIYLVVIYLAFDLCACICACVPQCFAECKSNYYLALFSLTICFCFFQFALKINCC